LLSQTTGSYITPNRSTKGSTTSSKPNSTRGKPVSIIIHDIDELVNSISVSTSLNEQSNEFHEGKLITSCEDLPPDELDMIQTIDMTNRNGSSRINSSTSITSTPL